MTVGQYRVIILPEAYDNLDQILDYIKSESPQNAAKTVDRLWKAAQSLGQFPRRYKVHRRTRRPAQTIRSMPVPPFVIYYHIVENPRTVRILTVRHAARQPPTRFGPL